MYAFVEAALAGTDVLEMDLQMTADGVLVVHHDATVDRRTETTGRVRDLTVVDFRNSTRPIGSTTAAKNETSPTTSTRSGECGRAMSNRRPATPPTTSRSRPSGTLAETFPDHVLDLEIKVPLDDDGESDVAYAIEAARVLAAAIEELDRTDSVIVTSFSSDVMIAFREFAPRSQPARARTKWWPGTSGPAGSPSRTCRAAAARASRHRHPRSRAHRPHPGGGHRLVDLAELRRPGERGVLPFAVRTRDRWRHRRCSGRGRRSRARLNAAARYSPMSSFQSSGSAAMNSVIISTHWGSLARTSSTPRDSVDASAPMKVSFSPITMRGMP